MKRNLLSVLALGLLVAPLAAYAILFSDVQIDHPNYLAIEYAQEKGYMKGYEDGTFHPDRVLNRAELLKVTFEVWTALHVETADSSSEEGESCFKDVAANAWYRAAVCAAKKNEIVGGYDDGTFRPGQRVTVAEAAKILAKTYGFEVAELPAGSEDPWYGPYLKVLGDKHALPASFVYFNQGVSRGELAEMIWRLSLSETNKNLGTQETEETSETTETRQTRTIKSEVSLFDLPIANVTRLEDQSCLLSVENIPKNVDVEKLRSTWLAWNNEVRIAAGLEPYVYNDQLGRTAAVWSEYAKAQGFISHKRPGQSAYYDYNRLTQWFKDLGLTFKNVGGSTHTENIGWDYYSCKETDCTDTVLDRMRGTFNFFMGEKGRAYSPHYDSIMSPRFKEIGIGVALDEVSKRYYLTVHYGTEITSNPDPVCPR